MRDRVYSIEKQQPKIRENANEALYETRQGRIILEGKIAEAKKQANDALYETRQGREKLQSQIDSIQNNIKQTLSGITKGFQQQINTTIANIQKGLQQAQADNKKLSNDIAALQKPTIKNTKIVENLPTIIERTFTANQLTLKTIVEKIVNPVAKISEKWGVTVTPATVTPATVTVADSGGVTITPATVTPATVRYADFSSSDMGQQVKKIAAVGDEASNKNISTVSSAVGNLSGSISAVAQEAREAKKVAFEALASKNFDPRVDFLTTKIKEVEKVNEEGNKKLGIIDSKLDKIIPTIAGIPIVVGKAADNIIKNIPTPGDIEKAATTGVCRSTQPGGCMNKALNDQSNNINNNTNNAANNILQGLDTAGTGALLAGQEQILNRLGDQLPGGIGGKLERFSKWLHLDRVLNMMIFAATVHNALMLSNDIAQTLLGAINNVLQLIPGLKGDNDQPFDIGSVINSSIENLVKGVIGADNYTELKDAWAKANRIYQATTNVLNSFLNLSQVILQANELIAGYTGKIGNALRKGGVVLENAYNWMNPHPKFNRVTQLLENLQNGASTIQMVTQVPLDVVNATTELTTASTDFVKAIKEDDKPENKATPTPEPDALKAQEALSKTNSQPFSFDFSDLFDGED